MNSLLRWLKLVWFNPNTLQELVAEICLGNDPIRDICTWGWHHIRYVGDKDKNKVSDFWQTPQETFENRTGDCEDFSILYCYVLDMLHIEQHLVAVYSPTKGGHGVCVTRLSSLRPYVHISNWGYKPTKTSNLQEVAKCVYTDATQWGFYDYRRLPSSKRRYLR